VTEDKAGRRRWDGVVRLASPAALTYGSVFALVQLGLVVTYPGRPASALWAVLATACYLPLFLWHVRSAIAGIRPPAAVWTLAALAAIVGAAVPLAGSNWLPVFAVVAVSAMLILPWPWSLLTALGLTAAQAPLATLLHSPVPYAASYYVFALWWRTSALFIPLWLLSTLHRLAIAQDVLAEKAAMGERLRIDGEMRATVGPALETIAACGDAAADLAESHPLEAERHTRAAVEVSRRALADARRLLTGYRAPSLAAEVDAAAALLTAAGIETSIELADADRELVADPHLHSLLRQATAAALQNDEARSCVIRVTRDESSAQLDVRVEV
jgi:two-component system sensor histidine kinase DesK